MFKKRLSELPYDVRNYVVSLELRVEELESLAVKAGKIEKRKSRVFAFWRTRRDTQSVPV